MPYGMRLLESWLHRLFFESFRKRLDDFGVYAEKRIKFVA